MSIAKEVQLLNSDAKRYFELLKQLPDLSTETKVLAEKGEPQGDSFAIAKYHSDLDVSQKKLRKAIEDIDDLEKKLSALDDACRDKIANLENRHYSAISALRNLTLSIFTSGFLICSFVRLKPLFRHVRMPNRLLINPRVNLF